MVEVVAGLIYRDKKVLIAKRSTGDPNVLGKWEFPGGKVEPGETDEEALEREFKEEFELEIKVNKFLINNIYEYPTKIVNLKFYYCDYIAGDFKLHDHSEYKWVNIEYLTNYDLAPADILLAKYVKEMK